MGMEDYAIILDYLSLGKIEDERPIYKKEPVAFGLGEKFLTLIELIPRQGVTLDLHERVYIGKDERDKVAYIKRRTTYDALSATARSELPYVVTEIVEQTETRYVNFFNEAQPLTTRLHQLELLPGIGKKLMWEIIEERKKKPFKSFKDISQRVKSLYDPKKIIVKRIATELEEEGTRLGKGKYKLFVAPFPRRGT
ncbi:MAG: DUF655 domain-containing protein [Candidatus Hydrothermarchaeales archaeon]